MKKLIFSVVLMTWSALVLAQTPSRQEQFILDLSKKKFDWLINKQYDSLTALLDDKVQYIHSTIGVMQNFFCEPMTTGFYKLKFIKACSFFTYALFMM